MNQRERWIATLKHQKTDKVIFYPSGAGRAVLANWRTQGLPDGVDWFEYMKKQIGLEYETNATTVQPEVKFGMIPSFEVKILGKQNGALLVQDSIGTICEIAAEHEAHIAAGKGIPDYIGQKYVRHPVQNLEDWERMKARYNPDEPSRFPADFEERCRRMALAQRTGIVGVGWSGVFWQLRDWLGFENLCIALSEEPEFIQEMVQFYGDFICAVLEKTVAKVQLDWVQISEDMAYKGKAMISPAMIRQFILPIWKRWTGILSASGCPLIDVDSDGYIAELIPLWIEAGINVNHPMEVAAGNDIRVYHRQFGSKMGYLGGIDKRAIVAGGAALRREMERVAPAVRAGGYIPSCDHGIPPEVTWPNAIEYCRQLARLTGWL